MISFQEKIKTSLTEFSTLQRKTAVWSLDPGPPHLKVKKKVGLSPRARKKVQADAKFRRKKEPMEGDGY